MLRLTLALLVARSSVLALQPVLAVRSAAAVRGAVSMQVDWDARKAKEEEAAAEAHRKLMAHLRAPQRQYEGGWGDTALRTGGKDKNRFGTGPDGNLGKAFDGETNERRKTKSSRGGALPEEKQAQMVLPAESFKVTKMEMSQTDEDFVMEVGAGETEAEMFIDIEPMFLTPEKYFYGFTSDSDAKISIDYENSDENQGELNAKDHAAKRDGTAAGVDDEKKDSGGIKIKLKFTPESASGEFNAHLCFIFPNEKAFSKFYKITGKKA